MLMSRIGNIAMFLTVSAICVNAQSSDWTPSDLAFEYIFQKYVNPKIYPAALPHLKRSGLNKEELEKQEIPDHWAVEWNTYPKECHLSHNDNGFLIDVHKGVFRFFGPVQNVMNCNLRVEFEASALSDNVTIELGLREHGSINPGQHVLQTIRPSSGKQETYTFDVGVMDQYNTFEPMIAVQGKVLLHRMRVYRKPVAEITSVEGEITECSHLPNPKDSDYPDCRFSAHFIGNSIKAGDPCSRELALVIDGFKNYKLLDMAKIKPGDKIRCTLIPFSKLPDRMKTTQQVDELNLFSLDNYYVLSMSVIRTYSDTSLNPSSGILWSEGNSSYISIFERHINSPIPGVLKEAQQANIEKDLARMNVMLADFNNCREGLNRQFQEIWTKEKNKDAPGYNRIGSFVWRNINGSFWCLPEKYWFIGNYQEISEENLAALLSLKKTLESNGVQLIVSIVPNLYDIAARVINPQFRDIPDYQMAILVKQLSEAGIETLYASDEIIANSEKYPFAFFFPSNYHPSDTCQDALASVMAARLERYHFPQNMKSADFSFIQIPNPLSTDYLFPANCDIGNHKAGTSYTSREVRYCGKVLQKDPQSAIKVLGNSFIQYPMKDPESYPTLLASKIRYGVDWYRISGDGPMTTIIQNIFTNPTAFLAGKKVIILHMGIPHLLSKIQWSDLSVMDRAQQLLSGRRLIRNADISGQKISLSEKYEIWVKNWENLTDKKEFSCLDDKPLKIAEISLNDIDPEKEMICVIPAVVFPGPGIVTLMVNGYPQNIPSCYGGLIRWSHVIFQLPAGTKSLEITAAGTSDAAFAIRNIMIYQ